jgi:hypothetical protein
MWLCSVGCVRGCTAFVRRVRKQAAECDCRPVLLSAWPHRTARLPTDFCEVTVRRHIPMCVKTVKKYHNRAWPIVNLPVYELSIIIHCISVTRMQRYSVSLICSMFHALIRCITYVKRPRNSLWFYGYGYQHVSATRQFKILYWN